MKKQTLFLVICTVFSAYTAQIFAQANQHLSNLIAPTAVNVGILPGTNNSISLGSSGKGWANIYLDSALYLNGNRFLSAGTGLYNTAVGVGTLNANTTGS